MKYEYWFAGIRNIPDRTKIKLKEKAGTAEAIYYIEETALRKMQLLKEQEIWKLLEAKKKEELDRNYEAMRQKGISVIPWGEKEYPGRLKEIYDPPYALYVKGKLPDNTARAAAIVGARSCTPYGEKYALEYGKKLAECGIQVISGLARGVDGIGQRGALLGGGKTFAVLGSGVDVCYPKNHMGLYLDILEQEGGILSELPPGTPPQRGQNIESNAILASHLISEIGGEPLCYPIAKDVKHELREVLRQALDECDIVIINGGSSKGLEDYNTKIISEYGEMGKSRPGAALRYGHSGKQASDQSFRPSGSCVLRLRMVPASRNRQSYEPTRKTASCHLCISHGRYPCAGSYRISLHAEPHKKRGRHMERFSYKCTKFRKTASVGRRHARHPSGSHPVPRRTNGGR